MTVMESIDTNNNNNNNVVIVLNNGASYNNKKGQFGDTTLTKVFVGGLAWETPLEALRHHFERFGDILEAVIISDKLTGRSKGYGFVTFKEAEAAKKACEDATPTINGRRANCNLAALGARRPPRSASATPPPPQQQPTNIGGPRPTTAPSHVQWYYRPATTTPFHPHHHQAVPFYGYSPAYVATDVNYNNKLNYSEGGGGGRYMNGQVQHPEMYRQVQTMIGGNTVMPYYPVYYHQQQHLQFHHHHGGVGVMGLPRHMLPPTSASPITPLSLVSRPSPLSISSPSGTLCTRRDLDQVKLSKDMETNN